jgi:hypothetical protein
MGFCALDRRRLPLAGDEVRACWEDAATPVAPDPAIPGLLDLLTAPVAAAEPIDPSSVEAAPERTPGGRRGVAATPARRIEPGSRSTRDWVEVEV